MAYGAKINIKDNKGYTPLHYAAAEDYSSVSIDTSELLLAKVADVNAKTNDGKTPADLAKNNATIRNMYLMLRQHGGKESAEK